MTNKQMEYTVKIVTEIPVTPAVMETQIDDAITGVVSVEVTNYRIKPVPKAKK